MSDGTTRPTARRWAPRGALVLLGVVVLLLVVFVLLRPTWFGPDDGEDEVPPELAFSTTLDDAGMTDGLTLGDDSVTSQTFTLPVPVDSTLERPQLTLAGRIQAASSSAVFLRALVDGTQVYVGQLESGTHSLSASLDLPRGATDDGRVRVQVKLTGSREQQRCDLDDDLSALVRLDGSTGVHGRLDHALRSVRDVGSQLAHDVTLDLAMPDGSREWFEAATDLAGALTQAGHEVTYAEVGSPLSHRPGDGSSHLLLGPEEALTGLGWATDSEDTTDPSLRVGTVQDQPVLALVEPNPVASTLLTTSAVTTAGSSYDASRRLAPQLLSGDQVALESLGLDTGVQQVVDTRTWRASYSLADLPGGSPPRAVRLGLQVPATSDDSRWLVQVQLGDRLLGSRRLSGAEEAQTVQVSVPPGSESLRNRLTVTVTRDRDLGGCHVRRTPYDVQLTTSSALVLGGRGATGFTRLPAVLDRGFVLDVDSSVLRAPARALAGLVPTLAEFAGWQQRATFAWDASPGPRPFLHLGEPPAGVRTPARVIDDRLVGAGTDLQVPEDGLVVQCAVAGGTPGVVITPSGDPGTVVPAYGRESARVVTVGGGGVVLADDGHVVGAPTVRAGSTG